MDVSSTNRVIDQVGNLLDTTSSGSNITTIFSGLNTAVVIDKVTPPLATPRVNGIVPYTVFTSNAATPLTTLPAGAIVGDFIQNTNATITRAFGATAPVMVAPNGFARITSTAPFTCVATGSPQRFYSQNPILTMNGIATTTPPATAQEPWGSFAQYSLNGGLTWYNFPDPSSAEDGWTSYNAPNLTINAGQWNLVTRQIDKAGNESDMSVVYNIEIESGFPKLLSITTRQPRGIYKAGDTLEFILDFERPVYTFTPAAPQVASYIIVSDRAKNNDAVGTRDAISIPIVTQTQAQAKTTVSFIWNLTPDSKNMPDGTTIRRINFAGIRDLYGNVGGSIGVNGVVETITVFGNGTNTIQTGNNVANLNGEQIKVYTFRPTLVEADCIPRNGGGTAGNTSSAVLNEGVREITLKFSHKIQKEMGRITLRPYASGGNFPIPPVFPEKGYTEAGVYHPGFEEIYNSSNIDVFAAIQNNPENPNNLSAAALRNYLRATTWTGTTGQIMATPGTPVTPGASYVTDASGKCLRTGLDYGPYKLTTQGLRAGPGYTATQTAGTTPVATGGSYDAATVGWNAQWAAGTTEATSATDARHFMVPDTTAKYVLDYNHSINSTTTQVQHIRTALRAARYRYYDIEVISNTVVIQPDGETVKITLPSGLPKGFQWELQFDEGVFIDEAGNKVANLASGAFWFWSEGVQPPVIRVERRSVDYRQVADRRFADHDALRYATTGANTTLIAAFNSVNFKMESETPGASITFGTLRGQDYTNGSMQGAFTGAITGSVPLTSWDNATATNPTRVGIRSSGDTSGTWLLPNLVRRAISARHGTASSGPLSGLSYNVTENNVTTTYQGIGNYWGVRSYNRDATRSQLEGIGLANAPADLISSINLTGAGTTPEARASKNYVAARARVTQGGTARDSERSYEGIFKTVVMFQAVQNGDFYGPKNFSNGNGDTPIQIVGSNSQSPTPTIAGFPLMLQNADLRSLRLPLRNNNLITWISTEIVSPWFISFASNQNNADIMSRPFNMFGESGSYLTGGYGDLTYSFNQDQKNANP